MSMLIYAYDHAYVEVFKFVVHVHGSGYAYYDMICLLMRCDLVFCYVSFVRLCSGPFCSVVVCDGVLRYVILC